MAIITLKNNSLSSVTSLPAAITTGSWIKIDTQSVTSGTVSQIEPGAVFSADYDNYVLVIRRFRVDTNSGVNLRIGTSSGMLESGYRMAGSGADASGASLVTASGSGGHNRIELLGGGGTSYHVNTTQDCLSGTIWINNPFNSDRTSIHGEMSWENATDLDAQINNFAAHTNTSTSYDRWRIYLNSGNLKATTHIETYGVKV